MKLQLIKTDKNCYVKWKDRYGCPSISHLLINGSRTKPTFDGDWYEIESEPKLIQKQLDDKSTNHRMVLKAELLEKDGFSGKTLGGMKPEIPREDCMYYSEYEWVWKKEYEHLSSLYELKYDTVKGELEDVEFECEIYCTIPSLEEYSGMKYEVYGEWENSSPHRFIDDTCIGRRAIDKIIYPGILHPSCPAIMSSADLYKIIRFHVAQNIDFRYADITSNYDFCFCVQKRIIKHEDFPLSNGKPTNRREVRTKAASMCEVFEMTPKGNAYKSYTVLPNMQAKSNKALKRKIDKYLKDLMDYINEPIVLCECCNGTGISHPVKKFSHPND